MARRAREAWEKGATEVCMVGGIHGSFTGRNYLEYLRAVKDEVPGMHVHAFSPMEIVTAAAKANVPVRDWLTELRDRQDG